MKATARLVVVTLCFAILAVAAHAQGAGSSTVPRGPEAGASPATGPAAPDVPPPSSPGASPAASPGNAGSRSSGSESAGSGESGAHASASPEANPTLAVSKPGPAGKQTISVGPMVFEAPETWKNVPPQSSMRLVQMTIPHVEGDTVDGQLTLFNLGGTGGGVEANIERWYSQVERPDGKPAEKVGHRETFKIGDATVTWIDVEGTIHGQAMMGQPELKGGRLLAAAIETKGGNWFFKATGPTKTMGQAHDAFKAMLQSVKFH